MVGSALHRFWAHGFGATLCAMLAWPAMAADEKNGPAMAANGEVGTACVGCHEQTVGAFAGNIHARSARYGKPADCDACHAGAAEHAESGDPEQVQNPADADPGRGAETCLRCHQTQRPLTLWMGSAHQRQSVGCMSCHRVHGGEAGLLAAAEQTALCFGCHMDVRAETLKRSRHPLRDSQFIGRAGKMSCGSCHNPHGSRATALVDARSVNDKCYECHFEKKAPVLWEHAPVKEDCLICHAAHGSSNDKLLVTKVPRLCQECHMQGRHQSGVFAPSSVFAFNRSCLNCHPQVHGSNHPSGVVLQR